MEYNSFSERVSVTPENIRRFVEEEIGIQNITYNAPTSLYVKQHLDAFDYVKTNKRISIRELHRILMRGLIDIGDERAGEYRKHHVRIGAHVPPPPGPIVESLMGKLEEDIEASLRKEFEQHIEWEFHNRFEVIHPFAD